MSRALVTGSDGQLGRSIRKVIATYPGIECIFKNSASLDITSSEMLHNIFASGNFDYCVNCAAYTDVEKSEKYPEKAFKVNAEAVRQLVQICRDYRVTLIHISTDYVFDGEKTGAYTPADPPHPVNQYGLSKWQGEKYIRTASHRFFIIRTSWLYSEFGRNFAKTMVGLRFSENVHVVNDQVGVPTYAGDLAGFILLIISSQSRAYGTYHYCNSGKASWYDFAVSIFRILESKIQVSPVTTASLGLVAMRPRNSILDTTLTKAVFHVGIPSWEVSLQRELDGISLYISSAG